ncbi:Lanosterol 14-alpha-demethylase [Tulasnella sp. 330]|nr:Lanosterol 14-alpha-demethylase [Tulasnella sp. 330]
MQDESLRASTEQPEDVFPLSVCDPQKTLNLHQCLPQSTQPVTFHPTSTILLSGRVQDLRATENSGEDDTAVDPFNLVSINQISPGDYVELRRSVIMEFNRVFAIHLTDQSSLNLKRSHILAENGVVLNTTGSGDAFTAFLSTGEIAGWPKQRGVVFLPGLFDPLAAARAGAGDPAAKVQLMKDMRVFKKKMDEALYNIRIVAQVHLYNDLRAPEPDRWNSVTLRQAVSSISARLSPKVVAETKPHLLTLAVHKYMMEEIEYFCLAAKNDVFRVVPRDYILNLRKVTEWADKRDQRMTNFLAKARGIIAFSDQISKESITETDIVPVPNPYFTFSEDDKEILLFLRRSLSRSRLLQRSPYERVLSSIGLALNRPHNGNSDLAFTLLQKLGASPLGGDIRAESHTLAPWTVSKEEKLESAGLQLVKHHRERPPHAESFGAKLPIYGDGVDHVRHDWGDLKVHVIDDATAEELDDGVSIEDLGDGSCWLHVHIADPTALIRPGDEIAQAAEERVGTLYLVDRTLPMLPKTLTNSFSLRSAGLDKSPMPVLTFSAKISKEGHIVDYIVRPAFVRNVVALTYDDVDTVLGMEQVGKEIWQDNGRPSRTANSKIEGAKRISEVDVAILRRLRAASESSEAFRIRSGACITGWNNKVGITMRQRHIPAPPFPPTVPVHYRGFPSITIHPISEFSVKNGGGSRSVIAEMMGIACRVAGSFARDRDIPIIYRLTKLENIEILEPLRDPETGQVTPGPEFKQLIHWSGLSVTPTTIDWLGIKEPYSRVTSPLRRYGDLISHWQLKASIGGHRLPFPRKTLGGMLEDMAWTEKRQKRVMVDDDEFWATATFKRLLDSGKLDPSKVRGLKGIVMREPKTDRTEGRLELRVSIMLPQLGLIGVLKGVSMEKNDQLPFGSVVTVDVERLLPTDPSLPPVVFHWIPFFGSAAGYGDDPLNFFFKCREKYGDVFTFVLLGRRVTVALGPKGNNFVLGGKLSQVSAEEAYTNFTTPIFGKEVAYDVPNHVFMEQKRFVKVGLTIDHLRAYVPMIEQEVEDYLNTNSKFKTYQSGDTNAWGKFSTIDAFSELIIFTASRTLQGQEVRNGMDGKVADLFHDLDGGFKPINFLFPHLPLPAYRRRDRAHVKMSDFYVNVINKRKVSGSEHGYDMIEALLDQTYRDGSSLTDRQVAHIMIAILMAGQHTSSATTSWTLLHLASRPDIMAQLYDEQIKTLKQPDGSLRALTYDDFKDLPILDSIIRETLRMHPPIHSIFRKVIAPIPVPGSLAAPSKDATYEIPAGHFLLSSPAVSQVDPRVWKNAQKWEPSRWADPEGVAADEYKKYTDTASDKVDYGFGVVSKGTESQYLPFGAGRHRCIGEQFAYIQVGTIIVSLIRRMEMKIDGKVPDHNYHTLIVLPQNPCNVLYRRRA